MNEKICNTLIKNKENFIPHLFTAKQIKILEKYLRKSNLTKTEKVYFYSTIKKKISALMLMNEEYYITGNSMIKGRIKKAKNILKEINKEAFISGSFLFSKTYNDIDIYILSNKRKQYNKGKKHFIFITKEDFKKPIFISPAKYSVANFFIETSSLIKKPSFNNLITTYQIAINEILDNNDKKTTRDIIFEYYMHIKNTILDSFSLYKKTKYIEKLKKEKKIIILNSMTKALLMKIYSNTYLYNELSYFLKKIRKNINKFTANKNLIIYDKFLTAVKDECRRTKK